MLLETKNLMLTNSLAQGDRADNKTPEPETEVLRAPESSGREGLDFSVGILTNWKSDF